jgi:hypothetical protein
MVCASLAPFQSHFVLMDVLKWQHLLTIGGDSAAWQVMAGASTKRNMSRTQPASVMTGGQHMTTDLAVHTIWFKSMAKFIYSFPRWVTLKFIYAAFWQCTAAQSGHQPWRDGDGGKMATKQTKHT